MTHECGMFERSCNKNSKGIGFGSFVDILEDQSKKKNLEKKVQDVVGQY
jgi:hypothetical protein